MVSLYCFCCCIGCTVFVVYTLFLYVLSELCLSIGAICVICCHCCICSICVIGFICCLCCWLSCYLFYVFMRCCCMLCICWMVTYSIYSLSFKYTIEKLIGPKFLVMICPYLICYPSIIYIYTYWQPNSISVESVSNAEFKIDWITNFSLSANLAF